MNSLLITIVLSATLIWLLILTIIFVRIFAHYQSLTKGVGEDNLEKVLNKVLANQDINKQQILDLNDKIRTLQRQEQSHIQRIGILRFNPFSEAGGDNSFTISLMDGDLNGIVLTGLHTREKTRMYAKRIEKGKSSVELSNEEKKVIEEASK